MIASRDLSVDMEIVMGELGCGDLIYELREQFTRVRPGSTVRIVSDDPGGPSDIPAWCRMTGRTLVAADRPYYIIREREEKP